MGVFGAEEFLRRLRLKEARAAGVEIDPAEEEDDLKKQAFRAIAQKDADALAEIIDIIKERVPVSVWSKWQNGGGSELLEYSRMRRADGCEAILKKALEALGVDS